MIPELISADSSILFASHLFSLISIRSESDLATVPFCECESVACAGGFT